MPLLTKDRLKELTANMTTDNNLNIQNETGSVDAVKFFSKLFEARQMAHIFHLQLKAKEGSHSEHLALNTFYDKILELVDELIETYQGQYGVVDGYESIDASASRKSESLGYISDLANYIKENRYTSLSKEDTHLQNIVDEIVALTYKTIYKLTNLK